MYAKQKGVAGVNQGLLSQPAYKYKVVFRDGTLLFATLFY